VRHIGNSFHKGTIRKKRHGEPVPFFVQKLSLLGSANGADTGTSTALDASIGVDYELAVALGDRLNRAICSARAASDAIIRNLVSHDTYLHKSFTSIL
jgi:hypothetical protein